MKPPPFATRFRCQPTKSSVFAVVATVMLALLAMWVEPCQGTAQEQENASAPELVQVWNGTLIAGDQKLRFRFRVLLDDDEEISIKLDSLDEGLSDIAGEYSREGDEVTVEFRAVKATFVGTIDEAAGTIDGQWKQSGGSFDCDLVRVDSLEIDEPDVIEIWAGDLTAGLQTLRMQFRVVKADDDKLSSLLDVLTQGVSGIPGEYKREGQEVVFRFPRLLASYTGTINEEGTVLEGNWEQSGAKFPYKLERVEKAESPKDNEPNRPQTPEPPFPYDTEQVKVENKDAENSDSEVTLAGTLSIPKGEGKFPAAILVSGSGPQDRDETLLGHKPFLILSDALARRGIAVLRFDDRGIGDSTGEFAKATTKDFASDAEACLDFLKQHESIDPNAIGIIGHSEGGLVGPMVAAVREDLGFVVMLAGPGISGEEIIYAQTRLIAEASGAEGKALDAQETLLREIIAKIKTSEPDDDLSDAISQLLQGAFDELEVDNEAEREAMQTQAMASLKQFQSPWFRFFLFHDPAPVLQEVQCPVLAIIGEKDLQVPHAANISAIRAAFESGGNPDFTVEMLPELNHLFQHAESGSPLEYQSIEETFDPDTLKMIADWILERFEK